MSEKVIKAYKGFDKNMQCRGFQYEIGKEYDFDGEIELCKQGFHACKSPIEVWSYYDMIGDGTRFAEVELSGKILEDNSSTKVCASHIKIKNELSLTDMINLGVAYFKDITSLPKVKTNNLRVFKDVVEESNTGLTQLNIDEDISVISINDPNVMIMNNAFLVSINVNGNHNQISKIKSEGKEYYVLGGFGWGGSIGLGLFIDFNNLCHRNTDQGFFGCATREIARHFGKYFGTLIIEAKYADLVDFEIIEEKYKI